MQWTVTSSSHGKMSQETVLAVRLPSQAGVIRTLNYWSETVPAKMKRGMRNNTNTSREHLKPVVTQTGPFFKTSKGSSADREGEVEKTTTSSFPMSSAHMSSTTL